MTGNVLTGAALPSAAPPPLQQLSRQEAELHQTAQRQPKEKQEDMALGSAGLVGLSTPPRNAGHQVCSAPGMSPRERAVNAWLSRTQPRLTVSCSADASGKSRLCPAGPHYPGARKPSGGGGGEYY